MTAEFDWWLLILGLVVGAGLVWLILAELPRRDADLGPEELDVEAAWIAAQLRQQDRRWDAELVAMVLREHRAYLRLPPPDEAPADQAGGPADQAGGPADQAGEPPVRPDVAPPPSSAPSDASDGGAGDSATASRG